MRWHATRKSYRAGELSVLAVVETVLAVALVAAVCWLVGSLWPIVVWSGIGLLLLLQTPLSRHVAIESFESSRRFLETIGKHPWIAIYARYVYSYVPVIAALLPLIAVVCKTIGVGEAMWRQGVRRVIQEIPKNWKRAAISIDSTLLPEWVPGHVRRYIRPRLAIAGITNLFDLRPPSQRPSGTRGWIPLVGLASLGVYAGGVIYIAYYGITTDWKTALVIGLCLFVTSVLGIGATVNALGSSWLPFLFAGVAVLYRLMLKATVVIYYPLLWYRGYWVCDGANLNAAADGIFRRTALAAIFAILGIVSFAAKILLMTGPNRLVEILNSSGPLRMLGLVVVPTSIPAWQVVGAIGASITIVVCGVSSKVSVPNRTPKPYDRQICFAFNGAAIASGIILMYSLSCNLMVFVKHLDVWPEVLKDVRAIRVGPWWP